MTSRLNDLLARLEEERLDITIEAAAFIREQFNAIEDAEMVIREAKDCIRSCVAPKQPHICHAALGMIEDFLRRVR